MSNWMAGSISWSATITAAARAAWPKPCGVTKYAIRIHHSPQDQYGTECTGHRSLTSVVRKARGRVKDNDASSGIDIPGAFWWNTHSQYTAGFSLGIEPAGRNE